MLTISLLQPTHTQVFLSHNAISWSLKIYTAIVQRPSSGQKNVLKITFLLQNFPKVLSPYDIVIMSHFRTDTQTHTHKSENVVGSLCIPLCSVFKRFHSEAPLKKITISGLGKCLPWMKGQNATKLPKLDGLFYSPSVISVVCRG